MTAIAAASARNAMVAGVWINAMAVGIAVSVMMN